MGTLASLILNALQWTGFALWSFFGWARRFCAACCSATIRTLRFRGPVATGAGLVRLAQATLIKHPGFEPEPGKPYFFAMNHQSLFDIVAAFVCIPVNLRFVAKRACA